ncbi:MAG: GNAT family N-acetyltransferase [Anaerotignaceae bacterium]
MKTIRAARLEDKAQFQNLWNISFTDSYEFRSWLFGNRFVPDYSICIEEEGHIVSEAQSIPYHIKVRDSILPATMMVGACTHPDYARRGYMKQLYTQYMKQMNEMGVVLCAHTPAVLSTYFYVGHLPVSDTAFIEIEKAERIDAEELTTVNLGEEVSPLLKCYIKAAQKYSGIIHRSFTDFKLKCDDYSADGGKCVALWENDEIVAYGIYYNTGEMIYAEEIMALNAKAEQRVVDSLINLGTGKKVKIKLPPDTKSRSKQGTFNVMPRNVLGLANAQKLLKAVGNGIEIAVQVKDDVLPENNGIFNFKGEKTNRKPAFEVWAGNFTQFMVGYKTIEQLEAEGSAIIYNKEETEFLDKVLPLQECHIIDEY